jgi:acyl carrier protein
MTREEIIEQVNNLLEEEFEVEQSEFIPDANLKETLGLDSINLVDLIALVQMTYKITIPVEELKLIQTFDDLYDYIYNKTENQ